MRSRDRFTISLRSLKKEWHQATYSPTYDLRSRLLTAAIPLREQRIPPPILTILKPTYAPHTPTSNVPSTCYLLLSGPTPGGFVLLDATLPIPLQYLHPSCT